MTQRWQDRGVGSRGWWLLLGVGVALMAAASLWAPPQPELVSGGACNIALCGTLEDPERWRNACWLWLAGAALGVHEVNCLLESARLDAHRVTDAHHAGSWGRSGQR
jgi:hypothetical protein